MLVCLFGVVFHFLSSVLQVAHYALCLGNTLFVALQFTIDSEISSRETDQSNRKFTSRVMLLVCDFVHSGHDKKTFFTL